MVHIRFGATLFTAAALCALARALVLPEFFIDADEEAELDSDLSDFQDCAMTDGLDPLDSLDIVIPYQPEDSDFEDCATTDGLDPTRLARHRYPLPA